MNYELPVIANTSAVEGRVFVVRGLLSGLPL